MKNRTARATVAGLGLVAVLLLPGTSGAQYKLSGSIGEDISYRDNFNFGGGSGRFDATTRLAATLSTENSRYKLSASSGINFRINPNGQNSATQPALTLRFSSNETRNVSWNGQINYAIRDINFDEEQPDLSLLRRSGEREQLRANLGTSIAVNPTTSLSFNGTYSDVNFSPSSPALVPSTTTGIGAVLNHQITRNTGVSLSGDISLFDANAESLTTSLGAGVSYTPNRSTSVNANLGTAFTETTSAGGNTNTNTTFTYGFGISHALPSGSVSASFNQNVVPTASGNLRVNTGLRASYNQRVNQDLSYGVTATYDIQSGLGGGGSSNFFTISPNYSRQLTRDVAATASYSLQRNDAGDLSQGFNVAITRKFDLPF